MKNQEAAQLLRDIGQLLELCGENRFKVRAYYNAAQCLEDQSKDLDALAREGELQDLPGIGKSIAQKLREFLETGAIAEREKLARKFPLPLLDLMQIGGLGPQRVRLLYKTFKVDTVEQLKSLALEGKLRDLQGFGPKIEENILKNIQDRSTLGRRLLLWDAIKIARDVVRSLRARCRSLEEAVPAGSLRRWKETVGDLDFLCASRKPQEVIRAFQRLEGVAKVLSAGPTKASVVNRAGLQCDLRVVPPESFGAALLYFTGSKEHNVALREFALKKGFTINEYGLTPLRNGKKPVAGRTEEEVYAKLGLEFIPPELRENRGEIERAAAKSLPRLVEEKDVRGDFHNHTALSDGAHTLQEMAQAARAKGWEWFVSGDHSQSLGIARGLTPKQLFEKKRAIEGMNARTRSFRILLGSEVDILADGSMDYDDATLAQIDFVVGSIHSGFKQTEDQLTRRILRAMENPRVDLIGHLTGRLIGKRLPYPVRLGEIFEQARRTGTALELNGQAERLDLNEVQARGAREQGATLALSTDAHSVSQLHFMTLAVATARRAWLRPQDLLNCLSYDELMRWKRS